MRISEVFLSIQGESIFAGLPTVFVRTHGCNMRCSWCDTKYAVEGEDYTERGIEWVLKQIEKHMWVKHICITGGEPLLYKDEVLLLIRLIMQHRDKIITVETDGGVWLGDMVKTEARMVMDIKCPSSRMTKMMNWSNINVLRPGIDQIKFVVASRDDFLFAVHMMDKYKLEKKGFDVLMGAVVTEPSEWEQRPSHTEGMSLAMLAEWIFDEKLTGVRLQPQVHKIIWPDKVRGF